MNLLVTLTAAEPAVHFTFQARIVAAVLALVFVAFIFDLIRRGRLLERFSIVWFLLGMVMLAGAVFPGLLGVVARAMGVRDASIALFSVLLILLLALALNFSVIASRQARQITRLAQRAALESIQEPEPGPTDREVADLDAEDSGDLSGSFSEWP